MEKKRVGFVDIAKGIAIICVIMGHTLSAYCPMDKRLTMFIYSFHMPLFFIISGWCLKTTDVKIVPVLIKKARQLLVPYILINGIKFLAIGKLSQGKRKFIRRLIYAAGNDMPKGLDAQPVRKIGMTWFLVALFVCQILYLCVKKASEEYNISMWILVIALAMLAVQLKDTVCLPFGIQNGTYGMLFYHIGYVIKKKQIFEKSIKEISPESIILGLFVWGICAKWGGVAMHKAAYTGVISVAGPVCGTYFVVKFSQFIDEKNKAASKFLSWCGKFSMYIYAMHALDIIVLDKMEEFVSGIFVCPSRKAALLFCVVRVTVVLVSAVVFVTAKTAFDHRKMRIAVKE